MSFFKYFLLVFSFGLATAISLYAAETPVNKTTSSDTVSEITRKKWFLLFDLGASSNSYSGDYSDAIAAYASGSHRLSLSLSLPGVYFPILDGKTLLGGVFGGTVDNYSSLNLASQSGNFETITSFSIIQRHLALSTMHFFGRDPAEGLFLRADLGVLQYEFSPNYVYDMQSSSITYPTVPGGGFGVWSQAGAGYAFGVAKETGMLLELTGSVGAGGGHTMSAINASIGILY